MSDSVPAESASISARLSDLTPEEPWPGLASYTEADAAYFKARESERDELLDRVLQHRLAVLYGLSGLGKSSLLQAGLFPALRARQCLPVRVLFSFAPDAPPLLDQVFATIEAACMATRTSMPLRQLDETLWEYFQRRGNEFWSDRNRLLTPVLAFDQFEEIFTLGAFRRPEESKALLEAIADLAEGRAPEAVKRRLDESAGEASRSFDLRRKACHVLLSLREDYLAYLEDLRPMMPSMGNRMRLRTLSGVQAQTVVLGPGGSLVTPAVAKEIVTAVAGERQGKRPAAEQDIDPALLNLLCRGLNRRRINDGAAQISAGIITAQVRTAILGEFYEEVVDQVSATARRFVEDKLLLAGGQRDSVALDLAREAGVGDDQIDILVDERLVRREERGGVVRLELTHDVLTDVVRAGRDQRREREAREKAEQERELAQRAAREAERRSRRFRWLAMAMGVPAVVAVGLLGLIVDAYYWAKRNSLPPDSMVTLQRFRLGLGTLPEMVPIPKGSFEMGDEEKQHVDIPKGFSLSKYEVTYEQFDHYVWAHQRNGHTDVTYPDTAAGGRGTQPVANVNWYEATAFAKWLGERTRQDCRLPTEAEWEYAARATTTTRYPWGDEPDSGKANFKESGTPWSGKQSAPVGSFAPNKWELHDMNGNLSEWTCSQSDVNDRKGTVSAQKCASEQDATRMVRGGSWSYGADLARSGARAFIVPIDGGDNVGFRVLCSPPIE